MRPTSVPEGVEGPRLMCGGEDVRLAAGAVYNSFASEHRPHVRRPDAGGADCGNRCLRQRFEGTDARRLQQCFKVCFCNFQFSFLYRNASPS